MSSARFFSDFLISFVRLIFGALFTLLLSVVLARSLGPDDFGAYSIAIILPLMANLVFGMGFASSTVYFVSKKEFEVQEVFSKNIALALIVSGTATILFLIFIKFLSDVFMPGVNKNILYLVCLSIFPMISNSYLLAIIHGQQNFKLYGLLSILVIAFHALVNGAVYLFWTNALYIAMCIFIVGHYLLLIALIIHLSKKYKIHFSLVRKKSGYIKSSLGYGIVTHISNLITFLNYRVDYLLLNYFLGTASTGIYAVAMPWAEAMWMISNAAAMVLLPFIASRLSSALNGFESTLRVFRLVFYITFVACFSLYFISDYLVNFIYGREYAQSVIVIHWLLPGIFAWAGVRILSNDLAGRGLVKVNLNVTMATLVVNVIFNIVLIPNLGLVGAAMATSISYIFALCLVLLYYKSLSQCNFAHFVFTKDDVSMGKNLVTAFVKKI